MTMIDLPLVELLAGLAEECSELAQAALKLRRVFDKTNPTPTTEEQAIENFEEEIADVLLYLEYIMYSRSHVKKIIASKTKRWRDRLGKSDTD